MLLHQAANWRCLLAAVRECVCVVGDCVHFKTSFWVSVSSAAALLAVLPLAAVAQRNMAVKHMFSICAHIHKLHQMSAQLEWGAHLSHVA